MHELEIATQAENAQKFIEFLDPLVADHGFDQETVIAVFEHLRKECIEKMGLRVRKIEHHKPVESNELWEVKFTVTGLGEITGEAPVIWPAIYDAFRQIDKARFLQALN